MEHVSIASCFPVSIRLTSWLLLLHSPHLKLIGYMRATSHLLDRNESSINPLITTIIFRNCILQETHLLLRDKPKRHFRREMPESQFLIGLSFMFSPPTSDRTPTRDTFKHTERLKQHKERLHQILKISLHANITK